MSSVEFDLYSKKVIISLEPLGIGICFGNQLKIDKFIKLPVIVNLNDRFQLIHFTYLHHTIIIITKTHSPIKPMRKQIAVHLIVNYFLSVPALVSYE